MATQIYTGFWTDWDRGPVLGATVTLSARNGGLLLAFLAVMVTIVAIRLWRILSFAAHQVLASNSLHDGLYYQRQHILRNASSPGAAIWLFLQQAWHWRRVADHALFRTVPWAVFAMLYLVLFAATSVLSSWVSDGATEHRIIKSQSCGLFVPADRDALHELRAYENHKAANYARQCYGDASTSTSCDSLPVSSISWTNSSVACPFEESVCLNVPAFQMTTDLIDSHLHLGINGPKHNRVSFRRETVCSPLVTQPGYAEYIQGAEAEARGWPDDIEHTHIYNNLSWHASIGFNVWPYTYSRNAKMVDITLLLIIPNSVVHFGPNTDPVFSATLESPYEDGSMVYLPDRYVSPIACADRYQDSKALFDNAEALELGLNAVQRATVLRVAFVMAANSFYSVIFTRTQSFLRAQERVASLNLLPLPSNQWEVEMSALFSVTLSSMQHQIVAYPTGPPQSFADEDHPDEIGSALEAMCHNQRVRSTQGTLNFSVLGSGIMLGIGLLIIVSSYLVEPVAGFIQKKMGRGTQAAWRWARDDSLQVMRMLFEAMGAGEWEKAAGTFPRTKTTQWRLKQLGLPPEADVLRRDARVDRRGLSCELEKGLSARQALNSSEERVDGIVYGVVEATKEEEFPVERGPNHLVVGLDRSQVRSSHHWNLSICESLHH
ncbi:hypothetical protein EDB81DRAFT_928155 [Dactylonectria macrodidyma]|uniref:Uncharacterized protein n=1 Tax=Dactylonectria macrodidyma TaxID=307937 RepID=A0A9P9FAB1_9HYPO|nr:hypothetical protein EDB81DRAFT_928155 [Dactylonectria macrodidyma]